MSVLARDQLLADLAGPAPRVRRAPKAAAPEPMTFGRLIRHDFAGYVYVAAYLLLQAFIIWQAHL